jgi:hypothetical protein
VSRNRLSKYTVERGSQREKKLTISLLRSRASPERGPTRLIVGIDVGPRAGVLEVRVVSDSARRARRGGAVLARAAVLRVGLVPVEVGHTGGLVCLFQYARVR